jgi:hypothetical protein
VSTEQDQLISRTKAYELQRGLDGDQFGDDIWSSPTHCKGAGGSRLAAFAPSQEKAVSLSFGTGILMPEEVEVVRHVYTEIASEDWFTRSEERREQFAASVIDLYRSGVHERHSLALQCRSLALASFGNGGFR